LNEKKTQKVYRYTLIEDKTRKKKKEKASAEAPNEKPKSLRGIFKK
jgi:hypothetical protein